MEFYEESGTTNVFLQLTKALFGTVNMVILGRRFCVLKFIIKLKKNVANASVLINKIIYWYKLINGEAIKFIMADN